MNESSINRQYNNIVSLLKQKRLKEAQTQLRSMLDTAGNWTLQDRLERCEISYRYMLQYMSQGVEDPQRRNLHRKMCMEIWEIADQARLCLSDKYSTKYYHELRRKQANTQTESKISYYLHTLEDLADDLSLSEMVLQDRQMLVNTIHKREEINHTLFLSTWTNSAWSVGEHTAANAYFSSKQLPANDLCLFVSAVTLSLLECFDLAKAHWLLEAARHKEIHVAQRAITGLALIFHTYRERISEYPTLYDALMLYDETDNIGGQLNRIYIQLLQSQETAKIDRKMREEIIPGVMKSATFIRHFKLNTDEENNEDNDLNPDWEKALEKYGVTDKLREINDLQIEGADVYMSTFSMLKNYPFFSKIENWFYPFDCHHSALLEANSAKSIDKERATELLFRTGYFCNSDKYSLALTMAHLSDEQYRILLDHLNAQSLEESEDGQQNEMIRRHAERPETVSNQYIHDLYRFFKLYPHHKEFHNPFNDCIALHEVPLLKELLCREDRLKSVADFLFHKKRHTEALNIYKQLAEFSQPDADIFQRIGFCLQNEKRYPEAVDAYIRADILKPDHVWTLRHLASCHRLMKDYQSALEYYRKVADIEPDNLTVLYYQGICLAEMNHPEEALQCFFKLDLLQEKNQRTWRAIAWCSFICGKFEQARRYYDKLIEYCTSEAMDYLNAGHVAWVSGETSQAAEYYRHAAAKCKNHDTFRKLFYRDKEELIRQGINEEDIPLMLDSTL